jgi:hypothetical protein
MENKMKKQLAAAMKIIVEKIEETAGMYPLKHWVVRIDNILQDHPTWFAAANYSPAKIGGICGKAEVVISDEFGRERWSGVYTVR